MKQYVLDEPGARPMSAALPADVPARSRWRWPIVFSAVAALGLVAAHSFVEGRQDTKPRSAEMAVVPVYVAPVAALTSEPPRPIATAQPAAPSAELPPSRVTREKGGYVVDLHAAAIGPTLAMLSEATHTVVSGSDVVAASPSRLTTSFVTASPLEAWKRVFGDVASFAMSCGPSACAVRFVSLVGDRSTSLTSMPSTPSGLLQPAPPAPAAAPNSVESTEQPMPDN